MHEKIRVLINGAKGRMGKEAVKIVKNEEDMELVGETDLGDDLKSTIKETKALVVVDFTSPACVYDNVNSIIESGAGGVVGTTGLKSEQITEIEKRCLGRKPGVAIIPNFAIGAILLMEFARQASKFISDVEIIELHHEKKLDSPSGTAIKTAEMIAKDRKKDKCIVPRGTTNGEARGEKFNDIPIHSIRLPGLLAHQEVIFGTMGQTLKIRHDSLDRSCFMPGVILSIREVLKKDGLIYGLENIIFSNGCLS